MAALSPMADVHFNFSILLGMRNSPTDCGIFGITGLRNVEEYGIF